MRHKIKCPKCKSHNVQKKNEAAGPQLRQLHVTGSTQTKKGSVCLYYSIPFLEMQEKG